MVDTPRPSKSDGAETAEHPGDTRRDEGKPAPGSGLDRRIDRNSDATGDSQAAPETRPSMPDPKTR